MSASLSWLGWRKGVWNWNWKLNLSPHEQAVCHWNWGCSGWVKGCRGATSVSQLSAQGLGASQGTCKRRKGHKITQYCFGARLWGQLYWSQMEMRAETRQHIYDEEMPSENERSHFREEVNNWLLINLLCIPWLSLEKSPICSFWSVILGRT